MGKGASQRAVQRQKLTALLVPESFGVTPNFPVNTYCPPSQGCKVLGFTLGAKWTQPHFGWQGKHSNNHTNRTPFILLHQVPGHHPHLLDLTTAPLSCFLHSNPTPTPSSFPFLQLAPPAPSPASDMLFLLPAAPSLPSAGFWGTFLITQFPSGHHLSSQDLPPLRLPHSPDFDSVAVSSNRLQTPWGEGACISSCGCQSSSDSVQRGDPRLSISWDTAHSPQDR